MIKSDAEEAIKNMKEDAEDLCYEARAKVSAEMEEADTDEV